MAARSVNAGQIAVSHDVGAVQDSETARVRSAPIVGAQVGENGGLKHRVGREQAIQFVAAGVGRNRAGQRFVHYDGRRRQELVRASDLSERVRVAAPVTNGQA